MSDDEERPVNMNFGGVGCLSMCALAAFVFWMCTGFMGCHNVGGWFKAPVDVRVTNVEPAKRD